MYSLRSRLVLGTAIAMTAILAAAGVLLYVFVRAGLLRQFDRGLIDGARVFASTVEVEFGEVYLEFDELDMREFEEPDGPGYLQLWLDDGSVGFRSLSLGEADLPRIAGAVESPACQWVKLSGGRSGRAAGITFRPWFHYEDEAEDWPSDELGEVPSETITLVLARETTSMDGMLSNLKALLIFVGSLAIVVSAVVLRTVIRRSLGPLDQVAMQISELGEEDLSGRVEVRNAPKEIQPVTERLNDLLRRLETAFHRERSFSSNVAHELRTPLAGLRSMMEVTLRRPRSSEEYQEALRDCLQISTQMQGMMEKLLSLARLDAGQVEIALEHVSLNDLIRACWAPLADSAEERHLQLQWELAPQASVTADASLLQVALRNILENAVTYADDGGVVKIETVAGQDKTGIRASNSGSALPQQDAERVFERFWRGDTARSAAGIRCGLGLSLVKKIAEVLDGTVKVRSRAGGDFEITLSIPSRPLE